MLTCSTLNKSYLILSLLKVQLQEIQVLHMLLDLILFVIQNICHGMMNPSTDNGIESCYFQQFLFLGDSPAENVAICSHCFVLQTTWMRVSWTLCWTR